jgi:hypothetical protein
MFAWICPTCGREVPPSESECPDCAAGPAPETAAIPPAAPEPAQPPPARARRKKGTPTWLLATIFATGFLALGAAAYYGYYRFSGANRTAANTPQWESPAPPAPRTSPVARFIEITGIRLTEDSRQNVQVQFLVVNHSAADIAKLEAKVTLRTREGKSAGPVLGTFSFRLPSLGPYESRELRTTLDTHLRAYEIPDWQFLAADVEITSP